MRLHHNHLLAALASATVLGAPAPAAYALRQTDGGGTAQPTAGTVQDRPPSSTDWILIGAGTAGGLAIAGAGVAATRRRHTSTHPARSTS